MAMELMKSIVDRNAGRLDLARDRIEIKVIAGGLSKRVVLGSNDWVAGFAYYEVPSFEMVVMVDGSDYMAAETPCG